MFSFALFTRSFCVFVAISLSACATSYGPKSFWNDGGFTETELQPNVFQVTFAGNEMTAPERTNDLAMLRAADLCLGRSLPYMVLRGGSTSSAPSAYIPGSSYTTATATGYGNTAYGSAYTTTTPGMMMYSPSTGLIASCIAEKSPEAWDAAFLSGSVRSKYGIAQ